MESVSFSLLVLLGNLLPNGLNIVKVGRREW